MSEHARYTTAESAVEWVHTYGYNGPTEPSPTAVHSRGKKSEAGNGVGAAKPDGAGT